CTLIIISYVTFKLRKHEVNVCNLTETGECPVEQIIVAGFDQYIFDDGDTITEEIPTEVTLTDRPYFIELLSDESTLSRVEFDLYNSSDELVIDRNEGSAPFFLYGDTGGVDDPQSLGWNPFNGQVGGIERDTDADRILAPCEYTLRITVFRGFDDEGDFQRRPCDEIVIILIVPDPPDLRLNLATIRYVSLCQTVM
ncbi:MAG: hypothetical protein AAF126_01095, partial [Chloroflexota bacterium]